MADIEGRGIVMSAGQDSSGSDSSGTSEEERLRRLFNSCDADGDGFLDGEDFVFMCKQLNLEDSVCEIQQEFGVQPLNHHARLSFTDFLQCRARVMAAAATAQEGLGLGLGGEDSGGMDSDTSGVHTPHGTHHPANIASWPTMSSDSLGAHSGKPESADYDSGARDLSPEPVSLTLLMQSHDPSAVRGVQEMGSGCVLDLADRLHLAAITSMKGEVNELKTRLHHLANERDHLERQVNMTQSDTLCSQQEVEARVEQVAARYEERIIELHSVIAELRKKVERHHINVIREEDEFDESDAAQSNRSQDGGSNNDNLGDSHSASLGLGNELSLELSRVVTEMESAMAKHSQLEEVKDAAPEILVKKTKDEELKEEREEEEESTPPTPPPRQAVLSPPSPLAAAEVGGMGVGPSGPGGPRGGGDLLAQRDAELNDLRSQLLSLRTERDTLHKRVWELQNRVRAGESVCSPVHTPSPTSARSHPPAFSPDRAPCSDSLPVAKVAGLKKLRTLTADRQALGAEISSLGLPSTSTAEHLVHSLQVSSSAQELALSLHASSDLCGGSPASADLDPRLLEYRLELERVQSRAHHLRAQNDTLAITLCESKCHAERLSALVGKYESNATALTLAVGYSDQALEASQALIALLDSEISVLLANCRAAGIGGFGVDNGEDEQGEVTALLQRSHGSRRTAESMARHLLHRLDRSQTAHALCSPSPWEDVASLSHTTSTTSSTDSGGGEGELGKGEEQRLRDYVLQLRGERAGVRSTVMVLEPLHLDPLDQGQGQRPDVTRLDLENAVLMQELMAMKEERAELKAAHYLLEKESRAQELRLAAQDSTQAAYRVTITHLRSELQQRQGGSQDLEGDVQPVTLADLRSHDPADLATDLAASLTRERSLKCRVQELVNALEKISRNSEVRHKQSAEFVNDLKRANSALITAFDKAKKRYQGKLKKLELQLKSVSERYETQIRIMKQRLAMLEDESGRPLPSETSL